MFHCAWIAIQLHVRYNCIPFDFVRRMTSLWWFSVLWIFLTIHIMRSNITRYRLYQHDGDEGIWWWSDATEKNTPHVSQILLLQNVAYLWNESIISRVRYTVHYMHVCIQEGGYRRIYFEDSTCAKCNCYRGSNGSVSLGCVPCGGQVGQPPVTGHRVETRRRRWPL